MMFDTPDAVDQAAWGFRYGDYPRSLNRSRIDSMFNGAPPFSQQEVDENNIVVNVNFLESCVKSHDARSQYYQAFLKPGNFFGCKTDFGPRHRRQHYNNIVTSEINKLLKRSLPYVECMRSKFASLVLHGIAPAAFRNSDIWCPEPFGVGEVFVPANTLLTMYNLPFFAIHRSFTAPELIKLTRGPKRDPAWNMPMVDACVKWIDEQSLGAMGTNWPEVWSPEKSVERQKGDGCFYAYDTAPTVDVWDFYFWNDDEEQSGWNRRMILDSWSSPGGVWPNVQISRKTGAPYDAKAQFLYNPGKRIFAETREQIINWQFADLSAVSPFRYHSVRSLGFLLYSVCHLQNRLRCKFSEAVFEQLMIYFRVKNADDAQHALKVDLVNRGFIDESVEFIKAADRYQVNTNLVELGLNENSNIINRNSQSNLTNRQQSGSKEQPTATQWMGEEQKVTQLVSAGLMQAYLYQVPEYREIFRRFCKKNSTDPDVNRFQAACLRQHVPDKVLTAEAWEIEPERVMGAGNKTLETQVAQWLMQYRNLYDPEAQRRILSVATLAVTDSSDLTDELVPEQPRVSDTVHDTELVFAALMAGTQVTPKDGLNNLEVIGVMLKQMGNRIKMIMQTNPTGTPQDVMGLMLCAQYVSQFIQKLGEDKNEKEKVKQAGDMLGKLMNEVKGMQQRQQEQAQKQAEANGGDPETMAKIKAMLMTAEAKAANTRESHAARTAQRQLQFEQEQEQKRIEFETELQQGSGEAQAQNEIQLATAETEQSMRIEAAKAALDARMKAQDMEIKRRQAEHDMDMKKREHEFKLELQKKEAEHRMAMEKKAPKAKSSPSK